MLILLYEQLPSLEDSQLGDAKVALANRLIGDQAFLNESDIVIAEVRKFIDILTAITWNRYRKSNSRETNKLQKDRDEIKTHWNSK